jgi:hypothetical protein
VFATANPSCGGSILDFRLHAVPSIFSIENRQSKFENN